MREWFRKRREYMSSRIFTQCERMFSASPVNSQGTLDSAIHMLRSQPAIIDAILRGANLEIEERSAAREFCFEKVCAAHTICLL